MKSISIFEDEKVKIDLDSYIDSRALICANSGSGKSYLARKILEESNGKVMSIVLDIEGEFNTLREKYDFLLIGEKGDIKLNPLSAKLLPQKLLELNVSTIIDISELKKNERIKYVKDFLEALMELPKEYWKPCLIFLDEAHTLAGQMEKQDSTWAVIDLMTRGRKRGYCGNLLTQRISKLHKDAVAECNNYFCGRTSLDIDMKRTADILGFSDKKDTLSLRDLENGEFYSFGTAICKTITKLKVAKSQTSHPKRGKIANIKSVKPTEKIKGILSRLNNLPEEAKQKLKELKDYQEEIFRLNKELKMRPKETSIKEIIKTDPILIQKAKENGFIEAQNQYELKNRNLETNLKKLKLDLSKIINNATSLLNSNTFSILSDSPKPIMKPIIIPEKRVLQLPQSPKIVMNRDEKGNPKHTLVYEQDFKLREGAMRMLKAVAMFGQASRNRVKIMAGISNSTTFSTYIQDLIRAGFIESDSSKKILKITDEGIKNVGEVEELPTDPQTLIELFSKFLREGAFRMLKIIFESHPNSIDREELRSRSEIINPTTFSTYLQDLNRCDLIEINGSDIKISEGFFE